MLTVYIHDPYLSVHPHVLAALVLAAFVSVIAYVHHPRVKALVYSLPVPFTCAYLATTMPVNATHLTGLVLVVGYNWLVYLLHRRARMHLGLCIVVSAGAYVLGGVALRPLVSIPFWPAVGVMFATWIALLAMHLPALHRGGEPGHRGRTPWWIKGPIIFVIALVLYGATGLLAGAVTTFPYAGVFTSYEARHSLRTLAAQFTINALGIAVLIVILRACEGSLPSVAALAIGWAAVVAWLIVAQRMGHTHTQTPGALPRR